MDTKEKLSLLYLVITVLFGVWSVFLPDSFSETSVCYWTDRMVYVVDCRGGWIVQLRGFFHNYWLTLLYTPLFSVSIIFTRSFFPLQFLVLMVGGFITAAIWAPILIAAQASYRLFRKQ